MQNTTNASDAAETKDPSFTRPSAGHDMQHWNYEPSLLLSWKACEESFSRVCLGNGNYYLLFVCAPQQSLDIQTSWFRGVSLDPHILQGKHRQVL